VILFFDTETSGMINRKLPAEDPSQPRLVQLGALLTEPNLKPRAEISLLVESEGTKFHPKAVEVHGITEAMADESGVPMLVALALFSNLCRRAELVVAHNMDFDAGIMATQYHRVGKPNPLEFPHLKLECTMKALTPVLKIPGRFKDYKWPSLDESHRHFFNEGVEGAHDALADVHACARVWQGLHALLGDDPAGEKQKSLL
jgi:DNA polymerase-3 subunit epsilon